MTLRLTALAALAAAGLAFPANAHHGWADYGPSEFELTGVVQSAELANPHGHIRLAAPGGTWDVYLAPLPAIQRSGLTIAALPKGARVTAKGHRHSDPKRLEMKTERLVVGGKTYDLYPSRT